MFLHGFEQGGLGFRWRAVDLVGEDEVREERAFDEGEVATAILAFLDDFAAGDVGGHQVGGELHALEGEVQRARERRDEERFREAGHAHHEAMAAGENGLEHLVNDEVLADDDLADLGFEGGGFGAEFRVGHGNKGVLSFGLGDFSGEFGKGIWGRGI